MAVSRLPTVRLPPVDGRESVSSDAAVLEMPTSSKFSVSWPEGTRTASTPPASERVALNFTEGDSESSDGDSGNDNEEIAGGGRAKVPPVARMSGTLRSGQPRLSRALSMPLPSQLRDLRNPRRSDALTPPDESTSTANSYHLNELSIELADSVQTIVQTMLQISPPQLLDPAKEQFSACSLSVPTSAMSAMLTSMKHLNYISANMSGLCSAPRTPEDEEAVIPIPMSSDFDIGEMLQNVGDSLSGAAAKVGVDLVLYHGDDIGLRHVCVKGAENGIAYALYHVIRQVIATTQPGDTIEMGLLVGPISTDDESVPPDSEDPVSCTIRITHKFCASPAGPRLEPEFSTLLLQRLLRQIGATLTPDLPASEASAQERGCDFTLALDRGSLSVLNTPVVGDHDLEISGEPTIDQLIAFAEHLKGKRVILYANAKGPFAQHLTSYLTAWGMEITHVSPEGEVDGLPDCPPSPTVLMPPPAGLPPNYGKPDSPTSTNSTSKDQSSFIFIDDDIEILKKRLHALRAGKDKPYPLNLTLRKRPSLASHHRPRSSPQVNRTMGATSAPSTPTFGPPIIVHFTSIGNYKLVVDVIQSIRTSHAGSNIPLPEIMIIPKPAGPRRFLTALHTAVTKPIMDPFFSPIATTPSSPTVHSNGSFFHSYHNSTEPTSPRPSPKPNRPSGSRSNSDRSAKSVKDVVDITTDRLPPPSPLAMPDNVEYFNHEAAKLGASPSSGLVIQSPDGQPAGIFFSPRVKSPKQPSAQSMERDKGQLAVTDSKRKNSRLVITSNDPGTTMSFSALHSIATTSPTSPTARASTTTPGGKSSSGKLSASASREENGGQAVMSPSTTARRPTGDTSHKPTPPGSPQPENGSGLGRKSRRNQENASTPSTALAAASKKAKAAADGNVVPPISVLIVDDNPINQTILSTFMKKKKIKYDLANNGQEAVTKFRTGDFHLILMDIQMPIMDGIQATKEIRRLEQVNAAAGYPPGTPENPTPSEASIDTKSSSSPYRSSVIIVALTASSLPSDRVTALAAGCNDFLTKPVSLIWLNSKIIEWGSLKALQMWADHRPTEAIKNMSTEQAAQARNVAERLHVPHGRSTPSPSRQIGATARDVRTPPPGTSAVIPTVASQSPSSSAIGNGYPISHSSPSPRNQDRSTSNPYWSQLGVSSQANDEQTKDLSTMGRRRSAAHNTSPVGSTASIHASEVASPFQKAFGEEHDNDDESQHKRTASLSQRP